MPGKDGGHHQLIPLEQVEERELRRQLLMQARAGDQTAKAKLFDLYGVRVSSPTETTKSHE